MHRVATKFGSVLNVPSANAELQKPPNRQYQNIKEETLCTPDDHVQNRPSQQQLNKRAIAQDGQVLSSAVFGRYDECAAPSLLLKSHLRCVEDLAAVQQQQHTLA